MCIYRNLVVRARATRLQGSGLRLKRTELMLLPLSLSLERWAPHLEMQRMIVYLGTPNQTPVRAYMGQSATTFRISRSTLMQ